MHFLTKKNRLYELTELYHGMGSDRIVMFNKLEKGSYMTGNDGEVLVAKLMKSFKAADMFKEFFIIIFLCGEQMTILLSLIKLGTLIIASAILGAIKVLSNKKSSFNLKIPEASTAIGDPFAASTTIPEESKGDMDVR